MKDGDERYTGRGIEFKGFLSCRREQAVRMEF